MTSNTNGRTIPRKNYILLGIILLITGIIVWYAGNFYVHYREQELNKPILNTYLKEIRIDEIDNYLTENPSMAIYIGHLQDEKLRDFEIKLLAKLNSYTVNDDFLYLNVTDVNTANLKYSFMFTNEPKIVMFENGQVVKMFAIKDQYNIAKTIKFLTKYELITNY